MIHTFIVDQALADLTDRETVISELERMGYPIRDMPPEVIEAAVAGWQASLRSVRDRLDVAEGEVEPDE